MRGGRSVDLDSTRQLANDDVVHQTTGTNRHDIATQQGVRPRARAVHRDFQTFAVSRGHAFAHRIGHHALRTELGVQPVAVCSVGNG